MPFRRGEQLLGLVHVQRGRLLADDMLAALDERRGDLEMLRWRSGDGDELGLAVEQSSPVVALHIDDLESRFLEQRSLHAGGPAASDGSDRFHSVHGSDIAIKTAWVIACLNDAGASESSP